MINQIATIPQATASIPAFNRDLAQARRIQAKLKGRIIDAVELESGLLWSPITAGPYLVPILRWIK